MEDQISRRKFFKWASAGTVGALVGGLGLRQWMGDQSFSSSDQIQESGFAEMGPIASVGDVRQTEFSGDAPARAHSFFWKRSIANEDINTLPPVTERVPLVVVGGGVSGLLAAYLLREHQPIVLEQATQLGGNSRGERWRGREYSIGAAYVSVPDPQSQSGRLFKELGIDRLLRTTDASDGSCYLFQTKLGQGFWSGDSDPSRRQEFKRVFDRISKISENGLPSIPIETLEQRGLVEKLDRQSFKDWCRQEFGILHAHMDEWMEQYCWSTFGGTCEELSAAQVLAFMVPDSNGMSVLPGGNAKIVEILLEKMRDAVQANRIRTGTLVIDVAPVQDGVHVTYEVAGILKTLHARACVFAAPKFVAKKILRGIPGDQLQAMARLQYRAYLVANVLVDQPLAPPFYDCFQISGVRPEITRDLTTDLQRRPFTDLIFGTWASQDPGQSTVVTLYRAIPFSAGREQLLGSSYQKIRSSFEAVIPELMVALGVDSKKVVDIRVTRWGHALPLAAKGLIASGVVERASRPVDGKIYFAQQDNWSSPCFETCLTTARVAADQIKRVLS